MMHGTFLDPLGIYPELKGKTALLRWDEGGTAFLAQFDDLALHGWTHSWHAFSKASFDLDPINQPVNWSEPE